MLIKSYEIDYKNDVKTKRSPTRGMPTDRNWKYCEKCEFIWEIVRGKLCKHKQQPYKIPHETCPECKGKYKERVYEDGRGKPRKFDEETALKIRAEYKNKDITYDDLMDKYDASRNLIYKVLNKKYPYNF